MYGKFFSSTFTGSMMGAGADVFAVWGYVIANTQGATVELNPNLIGAILGMRADAVEKAIEFLCSPDLKSRNPDQEGRRLISEGAFLYHVVSHDIYKAIRDEDDRRRQNREAQQRHRQRLKGVSPDNADNNHSQPRKPESAHAEADTYTEEEIPSPVPKNGNGKVKHTDSRFSPFKDLIFRCYKKLNNDQDPPWGASESKQLKIFLQENPKIDEPAVKALLTNYYYSKNHPPGLRPRAFIPNLSTYTREINKFNREEEAQ